MTAYGALPIWVSNPAADAVVRGIAAEVFLILPHPQVLEYFRRKASDYDRWIMGMKRLQARFGDSL